MPALTRFFGWLCPHCGKSSLVSCATFSLRASAQNLFCDCGKDPLSVEPTRGGFSLCIPCGLCGATHQVQLSETALLQGHGVALACPASGQLCCYIGQQQPVHQAMAQLTLLGAQSRQKPSPEAFAESSILHEILSELKEIATRPNGIYCGCGSTRYAMHVRPAAVDLICGDCGARLRIGAACDEDLDALCCRMRLQIPGGRR